MIRSTLKKIIFWATNSTHSPVSKIGGISTLGSDNGMNFSLYTASGGYVVEFRQYDHNTDRHNNKLHIINSDEDVGQKIGQIITLELLRN